MEPVSFYIACRKSFGKDFILWEPFTRKTSLKRDFNITLSQDDQNMLEAMVTLHINDMAWEEFYLFEKVVWSLNNHTPRMDIAEIPPSPYIAYAVFIMNAIKEKRSFSEEVKKYIAAVLANEGICYSPEPLNMVQPFLNTFVEDKELIKKIKIEWDKIKDTDLTKKTFNTDDAILAQLGKLTMIQIYITRKENLIREELVIKEKK